MPPAPRQVRGRDRTAHHRDHQHLPLTAPTPTACTTPDNAPANLVFARTSSLYLPVLAQSTSGAHLEGFERSQTIPATVLSGFSQQTPLYIVGALTHFVGEAAPNWYPRGCSCMDKPSLRRLTLQHHHLIATATDLLRDAESPEELQLLDFCVESSADCSGRLRALYRLQYGEDPCSGAIIPGTRTALVRATSN